MIPNPRWKNVQSPFSSLHTSVLANQNKIKASSDSNSEQAQLSYNRASALAKASLSKTLMSTFVVFMYAKSLNMISIIITGTTLLGAISSISNVNQVFSRYQHPKISLLIPKLTYIAINAIPVIVVCYSSLRIGAIPKTDADWAGSVPLIPDPEPIHFG